MLESHDELFCLYDSMQSQSAATAASDNIAEVESDQLGVEFWKTKYEQLEEHCKVINEQKVNRWHGKLSSSWHLVSVSIGR